MTFGGDRIFPLPVFFLHNLPAGADDLPLLASSCVILLWPSLTLESRNPWWIEDLRIAFQSVFPARGRYGPCAPPDRSSHRVFPLLKGRQLVILSEMRPAQPWKFRLHNFFFFLFPYPVFFRSSGVFPIMRREGFNPRYRRQVESSPL